MSVADDPRPMPEGRGPTPGLPEIRLLDPVTIDQIAAGEVVERPASVVKELVENAIDAGARVVTVEMVDSGRRLIRVSDDGHGMDESSVVSCVLRHATSKIRSTTDLQKVASFGFRGEAMPSIASVSRMTVSSGTGDGSRTRLTVDAGKPDRPATEPGPRGTTIEVEDLFLNVPARLKFLKSDATEIAAAVDAVNKAAVARPDVAFVLSHEESVLVRTSGTGDMLTAVAEVWGRDVARALVPVDSYSGPVRVTGFVSPPHFTKPTRTMQWFFVNGRSVRSRMLTAALDQAVKSLTPERRHPVVVLEVSTDPASLDVNVSPTKTEVKFQYEGQAFDAVRRAVKEALLAHGMVPSIDDLAAVNHALQPVGQALLDDSQWGSGHPSARTGPGVWAELGAASLAAQAPAVEGSSPTGTTYADLLDGLKVLGQVDNTLIVAENRTAILVIDQHVAHERILYEMLCRTRGSAPIEVQQLLQPETVQVGKRALVALEEKLDALRQIGFDVEPFGGDSLLVRAVPALGRGRTALQVLRDLVDELVEGGQSGCLTPTRDDVYIMCSCKMAVKAGDKLGLAEMEKLVTDLAETENPYLCPHGRPITIVLAKSDLLRRFKR